MKKFPEYQSHTAAQKWGCFSCCASLEGVEPKRSEYPRGMGQWQLKCRKCGLSKWYDVKER